MHATKAATVQRAWTELVANAPCWHLAATARRSEALVDLGRLRGSAAGAGEAGGRVFVREAAEKILRVVGAAVARDELLTKIRAHVGPSR